jgi:hypothetical protein
VGTLYDGTQSFQAHNDEARRQLQAMAHMSEEQHSAFYRSSLHPKILDFAGFDAASGTLPHVHDMIENIKLFVPNATDREDISAAYDDELKLLSMSTYPPDEFIGKLLNINNRYRNQGFNQAAIERFEESSIKHLRSQTEPMNVAVSNLDMEYRYKHIPLPIPDRKLASICQMIMRQLPVNVELRTTRPTAIPRDKSSRHPSRSAQTRTFTMPHSLTAALSND